ncbi:MAG: septum formation initiator family protein [Spirochaetaceae bacterium]
MAFSFQSVIWGEKGFLAYNRLEKYKERLEENEERLYEIQHNLEGRFKRFTNDREAIKTSARSLGYYDEDETKLYIDGYTQEKPFYQVGRAIGNFKPETVDPLVFRIVALLTGCITYVLARAKKNRAKRRFRQ